MDFTTAQQAPVPITIDGTAYQLPRFLNAAFKAWAAQINKEAEDKALAELGDATTNPAVRHDRVRFRMYFQPAPIDIAELVRRAVSPEGAEYIVTAQMRAAGVPREKVDAVLASADPMDIRYLADQLLSAQQVLEKLGVDPETEKADPLPQPAGGSEDSPATGGETSPASAASTAAST